MFQQDHQVKGCLKYWQVRDSGVPESYQPIVMPSSLDTQHHYRECPPAMNDAWYKFNVYWDGPHTHPAKAGLVQYASYTTKCPGTTSGLSGKQATHDGAQALPPVGTGPAHKSFARPEEWRNTFRWQSSYTTSVQELSPPQASYATKRPGTGEKNQVTWEHSYVMNLCRIVWKAQGPCHIRFRLVTAINLTTNWCTTETLPKTKEK